MTPSLADGMVANALDLDWQAFQQWLVGFASIRFDLEKGQMVDDCFPKGSISPEEEIDIAFSSFPDSMSTVHNKASLHDTVFFFRVRRRGTPTFRPPPPLKEQQRLSSGVQSQAADGSLDWMGRSWTEPNPSLSDHRPMTLVAHRQVKRSPFHTAQARSGEIAGRATSRSQSPLRLPSAAELPAPQESSVSRAEETSQHMNGKNGVEAKPDSSAPFVGSTRYLYGFVFNRQRHDERLPRGGEQKSVVVLTERPYSAVFRQLAQVVGPLFFDYGTVALIQVSHAVAQWPKPVLGASMELAVGHSLIRAQLPPSHTLPPTSQTPLDDFTAAMAPAPRNNTISQGIFHEADLFGMCRGVLMQLWVLWELLLVGQPLLVLAPTPAQASEAVAALVGLIAPLPCSLDFRPYFTIHDPDFPALSTLKDGDPIPPIILGVTNLFFLRALKCFPHVLSVGRPLQGASIGGSSRNSGMMHPNSQVSTREPRARLPVPLPTTAALQSMAASTLYSVIAAGTRSISKLRREGPLSLMTEHREALWTNYTPAAKPDTSILNRLVDPSTGPLGATSSTGSNSVGSVVPGAFLIGGIGGGAGSAFGDSQSFPSTVAGRTTAAQQSEILSLVNNEILRRHFVEVTTNFLAPFGPFLRASAPPEGSSPFRDPPHLPPFDAVEFLQQLSSRGPGKFLAKRLNPSTWIELYRRFMEGPNFMPWFQRRRAVAEAQQRRLWCRAREKADIRRFISTMAEGQLMEAFYALERQISSELNSVGVSADTPVVAKLRGDMRCVFNEMPRDTQQMILFNPEYTALLQGGRVPASRPPGKPLLFSASVDHTRVKRDDPQEESTGKEARPSSAEQVQSVGARLGVYAFTFGSTTERSGNESGASSLEEALSDTGLPGRIRVARERMGEQYSGARGSEQAASDSSGGLSPWETPPWIAQAHRMKSNKRPGIWVVRSGEVVIEGQVRSPALAPDTASTSGAGLSAGGDSSMDEGRGRHELGGSGENQSQSMISVRSDSILEVANQASEGIARDGSSDGSSGKDNVASPWGSDLWSFTRRGWSLGGGLAPSRLSTSAPTTPSAYAPDFPQTVIMPPRAESANRQGELASTFRQRGRLVGLSAAARWTSSDFSPDGDDDVLSRGPLNPSPFNPLV